MVNYNNLMELKVLSYINNLSADPIRRYISLDNEIKIFSIAKGSKPARTKIKLIDDIMQRSGLLKRINSGTNRLIYLNLENPIQLFKVALDKTALNDGQREFYNQKFILPYCTRIFEVSETGVVSSSECVSDFKTYEDFSMFSNKILNILNKLMKNGYILDDVGSSFYKNWGMRFNTPVLLDFPYLYISENDDVLLCKNEVANNIICNSHLCIDRQFNYLYCPVCGKSEIALAHTGLTLIEPNYLYKYKNSEIIKADGLKRILSHTVDHNGNIINRNLYNNFRTDFMKQLNPKDTAPLENFLK